MGGCGLTLAVPDGRDRAARRERRFWRACRTSCAGSAKRRRRCSRRRTGCAGRHRLPGLQPAGGEAGAAAEPARSRSSTTSRRRSGPIGSSGRAGWRASSTGCSPSCRSSRTFHRRIGGPPCTYVGHPLITRLGDLRPAAGERLPLERGRPAGAAGAARQPTERGQPPDGAFGETVRRVAAAVRAAGGAAAGGAAACRRDPGAHRRLAGQADDRRRRGREARRLPPGARGARRLRHGDAGTGARRACRWWSPIVSIRSCGRSSSLLKAKSIVLPNLILDELAIPEFLDGAQRSGAARRGAAAAAARRAGAGGAACRLRAPRAADGPGRTGAERAGGAKRSWRR